MRIHIGSDHAGLELKAQLIEHLVSGGHDVTDHGPYEYDALDDYPDFCIPAAEAVAKDPAETCKVFCTVISAVSFTSEF